MEKITNLGINVGKYHGAVGIVTMCVDKHLRLRWRCLRYPGENLHLAGLREADWDPQMANGPLAWKVKY